MNKGKKNIYYLNLLFPIMYITHVYNCTIIYIYRDVYLYIYIHILCQCYRGWVFLEAETINKCRLPGKARLDKQPLIVQVNTPLLLILKWTFPSGRETLQTDLPPYTYKIHVSIRAGQTERKRITHSALLWAGWHSYNSDSEDLMMTDWRRWVNSVSTSVVVK